MEGVRGGLKLATLKATRLVLSFVLLVMPADVSWSQTGAPAAHPQHDFFHVVLGGSFSGPVSGRLLLFIGQASGDSTKVDMDMMSPESVYVVAKEVSRLAPGESVDVDADDLVFPRPLAQAAAGSYRVQAVLDVGHTYKSATKDAHRAIL